jgi:hypothetical protein
MGRIRQRDARQAKRHENMPELTDRAAWPLRGAYDARDHARVLLVWCGPASDQSVAVLALARSVASGRPKDDRVLKLEIAELHRVM